MSLPVPLVATLRRILPMLASTADSEVIAARDAIIAELAAHQRDLRDLASAIMQDAEPGDETERSDCLMARQSSALDGGRLSPRERQFVSRMGRQRATPEQRNLLRHIYRRLNGRAA